MKPKVSIITPVYNGERFIAQAIESVLAQTYPHWELIVVDDGSTDNTREVVARFTDPRIRYVYQENRGQAAALNHGLELARGEYVTTLDADDWLTPTSFQDRATYLDAHAEFDAVYCDGYYCGPSGEIIMRFSDNRVGNPTGDIYDSLVVTSLFAAGSAVMIRRELLLEHGLQYDESIMWCQDWDFYIRVSQWARFGYVDSCTVYYRLHGANMTQTMPSGRRLESLIRTRHKVLESARFADVSLAQKRAFFYGFLARDLAGRVKDQERVINSGPFRSLPQKEQARLLRQMATCYLLRGEYPSPLKRWLRSAWLLAPLDAKTGLVTMVSGLSLALAASLARAWHQSRQTGSSLSPFELAKGVPRQQVDDL